MAETQEATTGYMGEVWLYNGTALYELNQVKSFQVPGGGQREQLETRTSSPAMATGGANMSRPSTRTASSR